MIVRYLLFSFQQILNKSRTLISKHIKNQLNTKHQKSFMMEFGVNMKTFTHNYYQLYHAGQLGRSLRLIRLMTINTHIDFCLPLNSSKHSLNFVLLNSNHLKKGVGIFSYKLNHNYNYSDGLGFKVIITLSHFGFRIPFYIEINNTPTLMR